MSAPTYGVRRRLAPRRGSGQYSFDLIRIVPEPSTQRILLQRGEIDIAENLTNDQENAVRDGAGVRIEVHPRAPWSTSA